MLTTVLIYFNKKKMIESKCEKATCSDMELFSYINWHEHFHGLILKSVCIPLPVEVVQYFLEEIIILPKECYEEDEEVVTFESCSSNLSSGYLSEDEEDQIKSTIQVGNLSWENLKFKSEKKRGRAIYTCTEDEDMIKKISIR